MYRNAFKLLDVVWKLTCSDWLSRNLVFTCKQAHIPTKLAVNVIEQMLSKVFLYSYWIRKFLHAEKLISVYSHCTLYVFFIITSFCNG